jgi:hypothetical protein
VGLYGAGCPDVYLAKPSFRYLYTGAAPFPLGGRPAAYWALENSGTDSTGNGVTLSDNFFMIPYVAGKVGNAAEFASFAFLESSPEDTLNPTANMSIALWFKSSSAAESMLLSRSSGSLSESYNITLSSTGVLTCTIFKAAFGSASVSSAAGYNDNSWHFVVFSVVAGVPFLSMDGGAFAQGTGSAPSPKTNTYILTLGASYAHANSYTGYLDEVGIWPAYALVDADVAVLWNGGAGKTYPFT